MQKFYLILLIAAFQVISAQQKKPFVLGNIEEIQSKVLSEKRILNIYLPEGYSENDTIKYPVIYLLDGSADEDFIHIAGLVNFSNFPWINRLEKSIVVGIANVDRKRDFTFPTTVEKDKKDFPTTGSSEKFINFIESELQPFIAANYHANAKNTIIGQSLGGLLATEILFNKPHLFSNYIIVSPSLWWNNESLLISEQKFRQNKKPISVYIAVGKEGKVMENDAKKLAELLKADKNIKLEFEYFGKEDHASILHLAVYNAFGFISKK